MSRTLDDLRQVNKVDSRNMLGTVDRFPDFLQDASRKENVSVPAMKSFQNIVFVGMGGSGSAGDVLCDWLGPRLNVPVTVLRDSVLPGFAGRQTLLITVSYSGETRETLSVFRKAARRGCTLAGIGSGGTLANLCGRSGLPFLKVPQGLLPREALPSMAGAGAVLLESFGQVKNVRPELLEAGKELARFRGSLRVEVPGSRNTAKKIALVIAETLPVIYCLRRMGSVGRRAKNQLAENAKLLAKYDFLPESGHNEVVAWQVRDRKAFPLLVRDAEESLEERAVVEAFKRTLGKLRGTRPLEIRARASSSLGRLLAPILLFDYVSVYTAILRGIDPSPTEGIQEYRRLLSAKTDQ